MQQRRFPPLLRPFLKTAVPAGLPIYTRAEVVSDTLVHCVAVPFALLATRASLAAAHGRGADTRTLLGLHVYALGLCASLLASAVYNVLGCGLRMCSGPLRRLDHAAIYAHIAGSYTPLILALHPGAVSARYGNEAVLAAIWAGAALGAAAKLFSPRRHETAGLVLYLALGCTVLFFTHAVTDGFEGGVPLLVRFAQSGACYAVGLVFFLDDDWRAAGGGRGP